MSYIPDNLDAYNAWQADQDRRAEMMEYGLPICEVCGEKVYEDDGVFDMQEQVWIHKGECLRDFVDQAGEIDDALEAWIERRDDEYRKNHKIIRT